MKNITMIAAIGENYELGKENKLLWHIPEDLNFFKEQTFGKPIVMGKKTLDSLPKLLPGRLHLVLTHQELENTEQVKYFTSIDSLMDYIENIEQEVMVIGGAQIYKQMLDFADKMLLTEIESSKEADAYFPKFNKEEWICTQLSKNNYGNLKYKHLVYKRKNN